MAQLTKIRSVCIGVLYISYRLKLIGNRSKNSVMRHVSDVERESTKRSED